VHCTVYAWSRYTITCMETILRTEYVLITVYCIYLGEWCVGAEYEPRRCEGPHTERGGHP
jgi:hypothetical protein